jgi:hypothetical protein
MDYSPASLKYVDRVLRLTVFNTPDIRRYDLSPLR